MYNLMLTDIVAETCHW